MKKSFLIFLFLFTVFVRAQNPDKKQTADSIRKIAEQNMDNENWVEAIINSNRCLKIYENINDKNGVARALYQLSESSNFLNDFKKSYSFIQRSMNIYQELQDKKGIADCYENIGNYFEFQENDLRQALENYSKGLKLSEEINYKKRTSYLYGNIARIFFKENMLDKALDYNFKSIKIRKEINDEKGIGYSLHKIGQVYFKQGNIKSAIEYAQKSMVLSQKYRFLEGTKRSAELLNEIYKKQGNYKKAYEMYELYVKMRDSISNNKLQKVALQKEMQYEFDKKQTADSLKTAEERKLNAIKFKQEKQQRYFLYGGLVLVLVFAAFMFNRFRVTQKQKTIIEQQKALVEHHHKEIADSINYAERIQRSFMATKENLNSNLKEYFVFFKPKEAVSGDFYWSANLTNGNFVLATADSTGHGVPGAIMSLLNITSLDKAVEQGNKMPHDILNHTRKTIIERLKKDGSPEGGKDGMDCSLCVFDFNNRKLYVAAANNPVWIVCSGPSELVSESTKMLKQVQQDNQIIEIKPDKMPVGKHDKQDVPFTLHEIDLQKGDVIYTLTDGFPDQFGGKQNKKFMIKNLREMLIANAHLPMQEQKQLLEKTFSDWLGLNEQIDDVTVIGVRV